MSSESSTDIGARQRNELAIDIKSLPWPPLLEGEEKTQMRRMLYEDVCAEGKEGGPLSKLHAVSRWKAKNLEVSSKTTAPVWTTVTCGTIFLEMLSCSTMAQSVWHDCAPTTKVMSPTTN